MTAIDASILLIVFNFSELHHANEVLPSNAWSFPGKATARLFVAVIGSALPFLPVHDDQTHRQIRDIIVMLQIGSQTE
jgi:hypothetical protein